MKTYEKNDIKGAQKNFAGNYVGIMIILLWITNIFNHIDSVSINGLTAIRSIILFGAILISARVLTKGVIKKFQITKTYSDNLRFNINLVIIAVAVVSLLYFLFSVNQNVKKIKNSSSYKTASLFMSSSEADEIVEEAGKQARKSFFIVWISIMVSSAIVIGTEGKLIEQYCFPDIVNDSIDKTELTNKEIV